MGVETALLAVAAVGEVGKIDSQMNAAKARRQALETEAKQMRLQTLQKTIANYDQVQKVLDAQTAAASVRGFAMSSPSFNAIQRNTVNIGSKYFKKIKTEGDIALSNIEIEKQNVKRGLFAQLFGDIAEIGMGGYGISRRMPTMGDN